MKRWKKLILLVVAGPTLFVVVPTRTPLDPFTVAFAFGILGGFGLPSRVFADDDD